MSVDADAVETITFDSFTTIVDVIGTTERVLDDYVRDPESVASLWRFRAVEYRMLANFVDVYENYYETTRDALEYALAVHDIDLDDEPIEEILSVFHHLDVFDDVYRCFRDLDEAGYDLYIVSNGNPAVLDSMVERADIRPFVEDTISADGIETYKPAGSFYRHAAERTGRSPENIVHVATPWYDVYGANNAGLQSIWVNRRGDPWETFDGKPDQILESLSPLPALLA